METKKSQNIWQDSAELGESSSSWIKTHWINSKIKKILWTDKDRKIDEYIKFRETAIGYYWDIILLAQKRTWEEFITWHKEHIVILQNIYKKIFPDFEKYTARYCLIWATPNFEKLEFWDFPWKYSLIHFFIKFKLELDNTQDS